MEESMDVEVIADKSSSNDDNKTTENKEKPANEEIVVLDLDDDIAVCETIDLVRSEMTGNTKCINYACQSGKSMIEPPGFCLSFYRVKNKQNKKQQICMDCYDNAIEHYDRMAVALTTDAPLLDVELPLRNDVVEIEDSDSDEEPNEDVHLAPETMQLLEEQFVNTMNHVLEKYNFNEQVNKALSSLSKRTDTINDSFLEVKTMFKSIRSETDEMIFQLSDILRPDNVELTPIDITHKRSQVVRNQPTKRTRPSILASPRTTSATSTTTLTPSSKVGIKSSPSTPTAVSSTSSLNTSITISDSDSNAQGSGQNQKAAASTTEDGLDVPPSNLPPKGALVKPALVVGKEYYANRSDIIGAWVKVTLKDIIPTGVRREGHVYNQPMYYVTLESRQKIVRHKTVSGKEIAYETPSNVQLEVGTRVIAVFRETIAPGDAMKKVKKDIFYPGIVAEPLQASNKYRYLIFFDDGYAQYVHFNMVHPIYYSSKDVWEDVNINSRSFIKRYLEKYPDRPMVKLTKNQNVRTEYNGKWWSTNVMNVDCSLVQMLFTHTNRIEWIYRGSTRLNPMFKEEQAASNRMMHRQRITRKANTSEPYVEYTRPNSDPSQPQFRSVARKSTSRPPQSLNNITYEVNQFLPTPTREAPATKIVYYTPRRQKPKTNMYTSHSCSAKCKDFMYCSLSRLKGYSPLSKPLLCGFYRLMYKNKSKKAVVYKAPCGRTLRTMEEVHKYLRITKSDLTVDLFDFHVYVRCLAEFMVEQKNILIKDLSQGKEECPITVVNYVNSAQLSFCNYSTKREPMEAVNLNTNTEFLTGCDCTDDCMDRQKCACWQQTLQCLKYMDKDTDPESIGYQYRRLPEAIFSGIYECNKRCKCSSTCLNRVVQNPLHHKLQIFQTDMKGWGIRCLNDIPQGSFICIYAGLLLTEELANRDGKFYGDEYLAELDFIETAERFKEEYEEDPYAEELFKDTKTPQAESAEDSNADDDDEDEPISNAADDRDFVPASFRRAEDSGIRTRLRTRNQEVFVKQENKPAGFTMKPTDDDDTVMISDDEDYAPREPSSFNPKADSSLGDSAAKKYTSVREMFGEDEDVYIMDAKNTGNIGRFLNTGQIVPTFERAGIYPPTVSDEDIKVLHIKYKHSCSPNIFVQNVFVDTHDVRFPWVAFFTLSYVRAGTELTWNYNYDIDSVPGKELSCYCGSSECKGRLL